MTLVAVEKKLLSRFVYNNAFCRMMQRNVASNYRMFKFFPLTFPHTPSTPFSEPKNFFSYFKFINVLLHYTNKVYNFFFNKHKNDLENISIHSSSALFNLS